MFSFERLKIDQIPIRENERRIKYLTLFRDLLYDRNLAIRTELRAPLSPKTGQPLDLEQRMIELNERRSTAKRMIALAGIKTRRVCVFRRGEPEPPPSEIDVIDQLWDLEWLGVSFRQPAETVEEAIGAYRDEQSNARARSRNPFFWIAWIAESIIEMLIQIVGWIAEIPVRLIIRIFRLDQDKAVRSWYGRSLTGLSAFTLWIFALIQTLRALGLLGWWDTFLQSMTHH